MSARRVALSAVACSNWRPKVAVLVMMAAVLAVPLSARADVGVLTQGAATISADTRVGGSAEAWTAIAPNPRIAENAPGEIATQIQLFAPTGISFDTGGAAPSAAGTGGLVFGAPTVTATTITWPVTTASTTASTVTFTNLRVKPNDCAATTPGTRNVTVTTDTGGTGDLSGASLATLTITAGAFTKLAVTANPTSAPITTASTITLVAQDACDNPIANFTPTSNITVTQVGAATATTVTYANTGTWTVTDNGDGTATIPSGAGNKFDAAGSYRFTATNSVGEEITFTISHGAITKTVVVTWVSRCDLTGGIVVEISNAPAPQTGKIVTITGTPGPDTILLTLVNPAGGGVGGAATDPLLAVNGGICPPATDPVGTPITEVVQIIINSDAGDDFINWQALINDYEGDNPKLYGVPVICNAGDGNDLILAGGGNDTIDAGAGNDNILGGGGNDVITAGAGDDFIVGGAGADTIDGGDGTDTLDYSTAVADYGGEGAATGIRADLGAGQVVDISYMIGDQVVPATDIVIAPTIEILIGTELNDIMIGNLTVGTTLIGGDGDDRLIGGSGNDRIEGNAGIDYLDGGAGDDILLGQEDDDTIYGGDGADTIIGGEGADWIDAGAGDDVNVHGNEEDDVIYGGDGNDVLFGDDGADWIYGDAGDDQCYGGLDDDFIFGDDGHDYLSGGDGSDYMDGGAGMDVVLGGEGDDSMYGGDDNDYMDGGPGNEGKPEAPMSGGGGNDIVIGGDGDDHLTGGSGSNVLIGGRGGDNFWVFGGVYDVVDYRGSPDPVNVDLPAGTADDGYGTQDTIHAGFAVIRGSGYGDRMVSYVNAPIILLGGYGDDTLIGSARAGDILYGESGDDTIYGDPVGSADGGSDTLFGGGGDDTIYGGPGADELYGDGDLVPTNLDDPAHDDDQFIQRIPHPVYPGIMIIDPTPVDALLDIRACLRDYGGATTVGDAFALPASELVNPDPSTPSLLYPGATYGGEDTIYGGGNADMIAGGGGPDHLFGGTDKFHQDMPVSDLAAGFRDSSDLIFGDWVVNRPQALQNSGSWGPWVPVAEDLARAGGSDEIRGGFGPDVLFGCGGGDWINGNRDSDIIYGDFYCPAGDDATYALIDASGAGGADVIRGNEGTDYLFGGPGNDVLLGGDESDPEGYSDRGWDKAYGRLFEAGDVMQGNSGNDAIVGCDVIMGSRDLANDLIDRGFANRGGIIGVDSVPMDTVDYSMVPLGVGINVDLGNNPPGGYYTRGTAQDGEGGIDSIYGIENVVGSRNADVIKGSTRDDGSMPWGVDISGRHRNLDVTDAYGIFRFPSYPTHPNAPYIRNMVRSSIGYDNILLGEDGDDVIIGRRGADALCGGNGNDKIWGDGQFESIAPPGVINPDDPATNGNDEIWGDVGDDQLFGEWGDDMIHGGAGVDYMSGGNGTDTLAFTEDDELSDGGVVVNLRQEPIDLALWGDIATTYANYGWPLDPVATLVPPTGWPAATIEIPDDTNPGQVAPLVFPGGTVLPAWSYNPADTANGRGLGIARAGGFYDVIVNRNPGNGPFPPGSVLQPDRFEVIYGTPYSDVIYGHDVAPTTIYGDGFEAGLGGGGPDILIGGAGNDVLYGEYGSDVLEGRGGNDTLVGSDPLPTPPGLQSTSPSDWVSYQDAPAGVTVNLAETENQDTVADGRDRLIEITNVLGSAHADTLTGNWRPNTLVGGAGDDILVGRSDLDYQQSNKTFITSDTLHGGVGNDTVDYRFGNPAQVAAAAANLVFGACPAPNGTDTCGFMSADGEGGTDTLVNVENVRTPDNSLIMTPPAKKTIAPKQSVRLDFYVNGGDGNYKVEFDPTWTTKQTLKPDGTVLNTKKVAILVAPADQANPVNPFVEDVDIPDYQAVRTLTGTPAANGMWRFTVYARPLVTTAFRVTVTDMNSAGNGPDVPGRKQASRLVDVVVAEEMKVTIEQPEYVITAGQSVQLRANIVGGTPPYAVTWEADNGSQGTTLSATNILIPVANPTVTTKYTVRVQDTTPDSMSQQATAMTKVTVLPGSGSTIPSGQTTPTGGSNGTNNQTNNQTSNPTQNTGNNNAGLTEVTGDEATETPVVAPMCGFGVTSWVVVGNLLLLAVMKRRRW